MALRHVLTVVVAIHQHNSAMMMMGALMLEGDTVRCRTIWMIERSKMFISRQLLGSYTSLMFKQHTRLNPNTFHYLCSIVAPPLNKKELPTRETISLETRVALSIVRLATGSTLQMCGELYGVHKSTASRIVREFCIAVRKHLKPLVIRKQTEETLRKIAADFEELHHIPYVMGAVDGSHIPIIAPKVDPTYY